MKMLDFKTIRTLVAGDLSRRGRDALVATSTIERIFNDLTVNRDPDWQKRPGYAPQEFTDTRENRTAVTAFIWAASSAPVAILSDIDGTCSPFTARATDSRIVEGYREAAMEITGRDPFSAFSFITGRSEEDVRAILDNRIDISVICSHGTLRLGKDGERESIPLDAADQSFVTALHDFARTIEGGDRIVQYKHSGIDIKDPSGNEIGNIVREMRAMTRGHASFGVHQEGGLEASVRYELADKAVAVQTFVVDRLERPALLAYLGDSFAKNGTDRRAAEYVQSLGGVAIQVLNDRPANCPGPDEGFQPDIVLPNAHAAASLLGAVARRKAARVPAV